MQEILPFLSFLILAGRDKELHVRQKSMRKNSGFFCDSGIKKAKQNGTVSAFHRAACSACA